MSRLCGLSLATALLLGCNEPAANAPDLGADVSDMAVPDMAIDCGPLAAHPACAFATGLVVAGDFQGVVASYDDCPAFVGPGNSLSTVDGAGVAHTIAPQGLFSTAVGPSALFAWFDSPDNDYSGKLVFWNRDRGAVLLSNRSSDLWGFAADATHVSFTTDLPTSGGYPTIAVDTLDCRGMGGALRLDSNVSLNAALTGGRLVVSSFNQGLLAGTLRSYDPDTGSAITLQDPAHSAGVTAAAGKVLLVDPMPPLLSVIDVGGGTPTVLGESAGPLLFANDGSAVFYQTNTPQRTVMRAPVDGSGAIALFDAGALLFDPALSPDGRWLAYPTQQSGSSNAYQTDARLSSATSPQAPVVLAAGLTVVYNSIGFTADSHWVFWIDGGLLKAHSLVDNTPDAVLGSAWRVAAAAGSRLVWDDDRFQPSPSLYTIDLASAGATPQRIAPLPLGSAFGGKWVIGKSGGTVFYIMPSTSSADGGSASVAGIYAAKL
jgi:hypothetical protein